MKQVNPPHRRALAALTPTLLVLAAPAVAQVATQTAPPPEASVSAPAPQAAPQQQAPVIQMAPQQPVVQQQMHAEGVTPSADDSAAPAATRSARSTARAVPAKAAPAKAAPVRAATTRSAPIAAAPAKPAAAPASAAKPVESTTSPTTTVSQPAPAAAPATQPEAAPATSTQSQSSQTTTDANAANDNNSLWTFLVGGLIGLIVILGAAMLVRRRRRADDEALAEQPVYVEPAAEPAFEQPAPVAAAEAAPAAIEPVAAPRHEPEVTRQVEMAGDAPVAAPEQAEVVAPEAADVEALTAADAPVSNRPWLEMAMRPVRAGTSAEDAVVEIELTIGNAGSVAADDVRIATFMFAGEPDSGEMERLLLERDAAAVPPVRIDAGEGKTVEATLAIPREALEGEVSPVIVADARYPLPGGGEGRTSASFRVGVAQEDGSISPISIGRPHMTQTVNAELYGEVEHA